MKFLHYIGKENLNLEAYLNSRLYKLFNININRFREVFVPAENIV